jgi:hypothetical protein
MRIRRGHYFILVGTSDAVPQLGVAGVSGNDGRQVFASLRGSRKGVKAEPTLAVTGVEAMAREAVVR